MDDGILEALERMTSGEPGARRDTLCRLRDGETARATLRAVRRTGPGRLRAAALEALTALGGPSALDPADLAVAERLIRIRRAADPIGAVTSCWLYWWCVRGTDQDDVIAALGLTGVRPATYGLAASVIDILEHQEEKSGADAVYVGPATNGWVPVAGPWCDAFNDRAAEAQATIEGLSRRYGEVHAFYFGERGDGSAWLVARDGVTLRRFDSENLETCTGDPLPFERAWLDENGVPGPPEKHLRDDEFEDEMWGFPEAYQVAAAISLSIGWDHPAEAELRGAPVLAVPPGATPMPLPGGFYEI